ncbi:MAG: globin domain-containing protein [Chloroflexi bacterium]|nr:globin domain-containing protein [Chloroflexota bacterium]MCI0575268.1 globin domain-containing protein [Chloroflexota bacterium]MCI0645714.1 globin domain-containing protein [Chloroflexota bacterium]MCI0730119.1 globin domain-containing protein [Chloroflexota bacterium]
MDTRQITLVQSSFAMVAPIADQAADLFYARLFQLDPSLRGLFPSDMREQKGKLMHMLAVAVRGLNRIDELVPAVQLLGRRHAGYGVKPEHYATVGAALLWTLEQGLGEAFTQEVWEAWVAVYTLLANTMQSAAVTPAPVEHALAQPVA